MAEDSIGWRSFEFTLNDRLVFNIANDAAVQASAENLVNEVAGAARANSHGLGRAKDAIKDAMERKAGIDFDQSDNGQTVDLYDDYGLF